MTDFLHTKLSENEVFGMSMLALAHVGDAVYDLLIRTRECSLGTQSVKTLHRNTVKLVSAVAQAEASDKILPHLTEREADIFRRGRNTKVNSHPKNAPLDAYHKATALECLFGYLYLLGEYDRVNELFEITLSM